MALRNIGSAPAWSDKPRNYVCQIGEVSAAQFVELSNLFARSAEVGPVGSQYESRIRSGELAGEPLIGLQGIRAGDVLLSAMSYGVHTLPRERGYSARIDLVVTRSNCRGRGLGTVVMAAFVRKMIADFQERMVHFSVVAQHPNIEHFVQRMGFTRFEGAMAPIYEMHVDATLRQILDRKASALIHARLDVLAEETGNWWAADCGPRTGSGA